MQKEKLFMNSCSLGMEFQSNEQIANSFLNGNWDNSMDQSDPFESTLSSIVSSPAASNGPAGDSFVIRELIGRIGNICNSGEICPQSYIQAHNNNNSTNTSCYTSPLNSPPKIRSNSPITDNHLQNPPSLAPFATDPGFAERAAALSCFGLNEIELSVHRSEFGKLSTDKSINIAGSRENNKTSPQDGDKKLSRLSRSTTPENNAESSASEQIPKGQNDANARKRKSTPKTKATDAKMVAEKDESDGKRSKQDETENAKAEPNDGSQKDNSKPPEPLKDYIHVRARRGQATDSHSLAERVRREKISERMKFLQDLVPGCNKVTGKAVMLDEIINYVQSLQRQVEFLSMKLATVNPRMDFNMDALVSKDMLMLQSRGSGQHTLLYPIDSSPSAPTPTFPFGYQPHQGLPLHGAIAMANNAENQFLVNPLNSALQFPPINGYVEAASQVPSFWEDDLHSLVQMGFNRNQNQPQSFPGSMAATQMKIEL